jgi:hypothetical protein
VNGPQIPSEADDILAIIDYLDIGPYSDELQVITGLSEATLLAVLGGQRHRRTARRGHIAIVAELATRLAAGRLAAAGDGSRGGPVYAWLYLTEVSTSQGLKRPIDILADPDLASEQLQELMR